MNYFAVDPHWKWWIIWYFFLGGIAAGAFFLSAFAQAFGRDADRRFVWAGYLLAAPLVAVCGVLLILDLNYPLRFWHMLLDPNTGWPHIKTDSPMSVGAWGLVVFSAVTTLGFAAALVELTGWGGARVRRLAESLRGGWVGGVFQGLGVLSGFFIASYTGALLTATNQPVWSETAWLGALFLASSAATGLAANRLIVQFSSAPSDQPSTSFVHKLEKLEVWIWSLEVLAVVLFAISLGGTTVRDVLATSAGTIFLAGTLGVGIALPVFLHWRKDMLGDLTPFIAAVAVLLGGFSLRYAVLRAPVEIHQQQTASGSQLSAAARPPLVNE